MVGFRPDAMNCEHCHNYDPDNCPACSAHRRAEPIDPDALREYHARYIESQKRGRLTASQLADQLKVDELTATVIDRYARTGVLPCIWVEGEAYFHPNLIKKSLRKLLRRAGQNCKHADLDPEGTCRDCRWYNVYDDPTTIEYQLLKRWQDRQAG